jgi:ABC-type transport system involved in multi-copper enzyme maturation permease subunit
MSDEVVYSGDTVGAFTGFGNFFRKEVLDWWNSWRLIIVFAIPTFIIAMMVFFAFTHMKERMESLAAEGRQIEKSEQFREENNLPNPPNSGNGHRSERKLATMVESRVLQIVATYSLLGLFAGDGAALFIIIIVFSTMGLLTSEKSTGTLAWNLTKPLGRTGLFVAKWLAATTMLWLAMCVAPVAIGSLCMKLYHGILPDVAAMAPVIAAAFAWIGLWVLLVLTFSLGFQSPAAVGGIAIAFWIVPMLFGLLLREVVGKESADWLMDRLATRSPMWAFPLFAGGDLQMVARPFGDEDSGKNIWIYAFAVWTIVLSVFSIRIFNRQEIGA